MTKFRLCIFGKKGCILPSAGYQGAHEVRTSHYLLVMHTDHLVKVVTARLPDWKVTAFPFVIKKYLVEGYFETM